MTEDNRIARNPLPSAPVEPVTTTPTAPVAPVTTTPKIGPAIAPWLFLKEWGRNEDKMAPAWKVELNPLTKKPYANEDEYNLVKLLNKDQINAIVASQVQSELQNATDPERDRRGCVRANLPSAGKPAEQIAQEAVGGSTPRLLVITPKGGVNIFDAKRVNRVTQVAEINAQTPNATKIQPPTLAELKPQQTIAKQCGLNLQVLSTNPRVVNILQSQGVDARKLALGGAYNQLVQAFAGSGGNAHHMPAKSVSPLSMLLLSWKDKDWVKDIGPALWMRIVDHEQTASHAYLGPKAERYRQQQAELIKQGRIKEAIQMDIDDIRSKFPDGRYEPGLQQIEQYIKTIKLEKLTELLLSYSDQQPEAIHLLNHTDDMTFNNDLQLQAAMTGAIAYDKLLIQQGTTTFRDEFYTANYDIPTETLTIDHALKGKLLGWNKDLNTLVLNQYVTNNDARHYDDLREALNQGKQIEQTPDFYVYDLKNPPQNDLNFTRALETAQEALYWVSDSLNYGNDPSQQVKFNHNKEYTYQLDEKRDVLTITPNGQSSPLLVWNQQQGTISTDNLQDKDHRFITVDYPAQDAQAWQAIREKQAQKTLQAPEHVQ